MIRKMNTLLTISVMILSTLACSLTNCSGQQDSSENSIDSIIPEEGPISSEGDAAESSIEVTEEVSTLGSILYSDSETLYLLDLDNFQSQQLVTGDISGGSISPDGKYLAYYKKSSGSNNWQYRNLMVMNLDTGEQLDVSNVPEDINTLTWSPNSEEITYTRRNWDYCSEFVDRQITGLYQVNILTNKITELHVATDQYVFWVEEWSPDGRYLLFSHGPDCSEGSSLMYYDSQTGDVNGVPFAEASWSQDGWSLAANDIWYWEPEDIPLMQYDVSTGEENILYQEAGYYVSSPIWSPNGEWIAFTRSNTMDYESEPVLFNPKTGVMVIIPLPSAKPKFWSPAGNTLVLSTTLNDSSKNVFLYQIDTEEISQIFEGLSGYVLQWIEN